MKPPMSALSSDVRCVRTHCPISSAAVRLSRAVEGALLKVRVAARLKAAVRSVVASPSPLLLRNRTAINVSGVCAAMRASFDEIGFNGVLEVLGTAGWELDGVHQAEGVGLSTVGDLFGTSHLAGEYFMRLTVRRSHRRHSLTHRSSSRTTHSQLRAIESSRGVRSRPSATMKRRAPPSCRSPRRSARSGRVACEGLRCTARSGKLSSINAAAVLRR